MNWGPLSDESQALLRELRGAVGQHHATACLNRLRALEEPAVILGLMGLLTQTDAKTAGLIATTLSALVERIPARLLGALDERIRTGWGYRWGDDSIRFTPQDIDRFQFQEDMPAVLGLASFVSSGYARERAVQRLDEEITNGREIPFLLLRLNDWVDQVREIAAQAVERRLGERYRNAYFKSLPLVLRLQDRSRITESKTFAKIRALLLTDPESLLRYALAHADRLTQRSVPLWVWATIRPGDIARQRPVVHVMLRSLEPATRMRVASWVAGGLVAPELVREVIPKLIADRFAAVRRTSLGWYAAYHPEESLPDLRKALLDSSPIMRSVAQFYLPKIEPIDLRAFYRGAVQAPGSAAALKGAIGGLGEMGRTEDTVLIVPLVNHAMIGIRRAAIRALGRLAPREHFEIFVQALQDRSPGVSRDAREALSRDASMVGLERLAEIFAGATCLHVRLQALSLIMQLPKWQAITQVIGIHSLPDEKIQSMTGAFLHAWLRGYNRTHHIQPSATERAQFRAAIAHAGSLPTLLRRELGALADSLR